MGHMKTQYFLEVTYNLNKIIANDVYSKNKNNYSADNMIVSVIGKNETDAGSNFRERDLGFDFDKEEKRLEAIRAVLAYLPWLHQQGVALTRITTRDLAGPQLTNRKLWLGHPPWKPGIEFQDMR